ncbi:MAG TPA: NAD-binding protein, partial [Myxococcota bacterium]|nr:NAD-binding protein [Myxococcota bacterium]
LEPFKGLLLGLFFIAVGMSVNLTLVRSHALEVTGLVLGLVAVKALVLLGLGRLTLGNNRGAASLAVTASQGGEFAFVVLSLATGYRIVEATLADMLVAVVSLSMAVTPFLQIAMDYVLARRPARPDGRAYDVAPSEDNPVIIAGMGRMGQVVGRILRAKGIPFTALDIDPEHIEFLKRFGNNKVFYGDASRLDLLRAARAETARVFVLAIDDMAASLRIVEAVHKHFPNLTIVARAHNRQHAYSLMNLGIEHVVRETFDGSLSMTHSVLSELGLPFSDTQRAIDRFREHDEAMLEATYKHADNVEVLQEMAAKARRELESLFESDKAEDAS